MLWWGLASTVMVCAHGSVFAGTLTGTLRDGYGTPVGGAHIGAQYGSEEREANAFTDANGFYMLPVTVEGSFMTDLGVNSSGNPAGLPSSYGVGLPMSLAGGDTVIDLTLPRVVEIEAHVIRGDGSPVQGATVRPAYGYTNGTLIPFDLFPGGRATGANDVGWALTDAAGVAHLTSFPATFGGLRAEYQAPPPSVELYTIQTNITALDSIIVTFVLPDQEPSLVVSAPAPSSHLMAGAQTTVLWQTPSSLTAESATLHFSPDGGITWSLIAQGQPNSGSYEWAVPSVVTDHAKVAVVLVESDPSGVLFDSAVGLSEAFSIESVVGVRDGGPPLTLTMRGATPNPSVNGRLHVAFSLRDASVARFELVDVAGRVLISRQVGMLGPGAHSLDLLEGGALRPGIYFMRLTQGGSEVRARAVVIR